MINKGGRKREEGRERAREVGRGGRREGKHGCTGGDRDGGRGKTSRERERARARGTLDVRSTNPQCPNFARFVTNKKKSNLTGFRNSQALRVSIRLRNDSEMMIYKKL